MSKYRFVKDVVVAEQPDAPLKVLEASYATIAGQQSKLVTLTNFNFKLQNISNNIIRAWGIVWIITDTADRKHEIESHADNSLPTSKGTEPNQKIFQVDLKSQYSTSCAIKEILIKVEFADGEGGLVWDPSNSQNYKIILARRTAINKERIHLIDLFSIGGTALVKADLEKRIQITDKMSNDQIATAVYAYRILVLQYIESQKIDGIKIALGII